MKSIMMSVTTMSIITMIATTQPTTTATMTATNTTTRTTDGDGRCDATDFATDDAIRRCHGRQDTAAADKNHIAAGNSAVRDAGRPLQGDGAAANTSGPQPGGTSGAAPSRGLLGPDPDPPDDSILVSCTVCRLEWMGSPPANHCCTQCGQKVREGGLPLSNATAAGSAAVAEPLQRNDYEAVTHTAADEATRRLCPTKFNPCPMRGTGNARPNTMTPYSTFPLAKSPLPVAATERSERDAAVPVTASITSSPKADEPQDAHQQTFEPQPDASSAIAMVTCNTSSLSAEGSARALAVDAVGTVAGGTVAGDTRDAVAGAGATAPSPPGVQTHIQSPRSLTIQSLDELRRDVQKSDRGEDIQVLRHIQLIIRSAHELIRT